VVYGRLYELLPDDSRRRFGGRLGARRGPKRAAMAVAHSIVTIVYHLLQNPDMVFNELGGDFLLKRIAAILLWALQCRCYGKRAALCGHHAKHGDERIQPLDKRLTELNNRQASVMDSLPKVETSRQRLKRVRWMVQNWKSVLKELPTRRANRILRQSFLIYIEPRTVVRIELL
jgi:hypothetical protein